MSLEIKNTANSISTQTYSIVSRDSKDLQDLLDYITENRQRCINLKENLLNLKNKIDDVLSPEINKIVSAIEELSNNYNNINQKLNHLIAEGGFDKIIEEYLINHGIIPKPESESESESYI